MTSTLSLRANQSAAPYCALVDYYPKVAKYREHFESKYCGAPLFTFDGIAVSFRRENFNHAFFSHGRFSWSRAKRIDWIAKALHDPSAWLCPGWDWAVPPGYNRNRRVCFVNGDYIVVIEFVESNQAFFKTAYLANDSTQRKVMASPRW